MTKIKKNETFIPVKNYVLAGLIVVVMLGATWYGFQWYKVIQEEKVSTSYLVKNKYIIKPQYQNPIKFLFRLLVFPTVP